ncbi:MAG: HlyD family secretion protein [Armatimonadota bacterium]|nr:HlyD family secretion protein [Armatimonadota bacterium]
MPNEPKDTQTKSVEHFRPDGNGQVKSPPADGNGQSKYAPPEKEEAKEDNDSGLKTPGADTRKKLVIGAIIAVVAILALIWGVHAYQYGHTHESTDDAYVTGNLLNVSPIISGTLAQLTVQEGDVVKQGQLIGRLDDSGPRAAVRQAQAAYDAAETQIPQARISLVYQQQATAAAIRKAQAEVAGQNAKTSGAQQQVTLSRATQINQVRQAQSQVSQAQAQAAGVQAQVKTAQAALQAQQQAVQTAQRAADAAAANIAAAKANQVKTAKDEGRYADLLKKEAVTQQQFDAVHAAAVGAQSQLESVRSQAAQAQSQVAQARAGVAQTQAQLQAARKQAQAADEAIQVARAGLGLARAGSSQVGIQESNVLGNQNQAGQAQADLASAQAGKQQVALRQRQIATYQAQAAQAKAALQNAEITLGNTKIYAPTAGYVVRKAVNVGASLSPGQTIVTMTTNDQVWVTANFKETQLTDVRAGQPAEIEVDLVGGKIFKGEVKAITAATGASTALLPPDNATGNFTKVVQRVPVRIKLLPANDNDDKKYARLDDIKALRQGLSVSATIDTEKH